MEPLAEACLILALQPDTAIPCIWHEHLATTLLLPLYFVHTIINVLYTNYVSQQHCTWPVLSVTHTL